MGNSERKASCCQAEVSVLEDQPETSTAAKTSLRLTTETYDRIRRRQVSLEEAREHNRDAIRKLRQHSLASTEAPEPEATDRAKRLQEAANYSKQLKLKILSSSSLPKSSTIILTPLGLDSSLRGAKDGFTYFGCRDRLHSKGAVINDFLIPQEGAEEMEGRHFEIRFDPYTDGYFLKDLGAGLGCFVKIEAAVTMKDAMLVHMGESFLLINIIERSTLKKFPRLRLILYGGSCTGEVFYFNATEYYEKKIHIGRFHGCEVHINDSLISKVQACVFFNTVGGWILVDGDMDHQRGSTNGTWLYASNDTELSNNLVFKACQTLFQVIIG